MYVKNEDTPASSFSLTKCWTMKKSRAEIGLMMMGMDESAGKGLDVDESVVKA